MSQDRLGNIDLDGIFAELDGAIKNNQPIEFSVSPIAPTPVAEGSQIEITQEEQEAAEVRYLSDAFNGLQKRGPREDARFFRDKFSRDKDQAVNRSVPSKTRRIIENMTLESLVQTADKQFKEAVAKVAQAGPSIMQTEQLRLQADFWALVSQIVKSASEIKDQ
jgi:hypothetical protein